MEKRGFKRLHVDRVVEGHDDEEKRRKIYRKCSALNCTNSNLNCSMFSFPITSRTVKGETLNLVENKKRAEIWVKNCGNVHLQQHNVDVLHKKYCLCAYHFEKTQFTNAECNRLRKNAIPTIFGYMSVKTNAFCCDNDYAISFPSIKDGQSNTEHSLEREEFYYEHDYAISMKEGAITLSPQENQKFNNDHNYAMPCSSDIDLLCNGNNSVTNFGEEDNVFLTSDDNISYIDKEKDDDLLAEELIEITDTVESIILENIEEVSGSNETEHVCSDYIILENIGEVSESNETEHVCSDKSKSGINVQIDADIITSKSPKIIHCCMRQCMVTNRDSPMFSFPNCFSKKGNTQSLNAANFRRFKRWAQSCGNTSVLLEDPNSVCKKFKVCKNHFEDSSFTNAKKKNRLKHNAVPTEDTCIISDKMWEDYENNLLLWKENDFIKMQFLSDVSLALAFEEDMKHLRWNICTKCKEKHLTSSEKMQKCVHKDCWKYTEINNMDPGNVPEELKDLTYIEEQLISRVHPVVSVFKLKQLQYGYRGNVINFPQDVQGFVNELPHRIEDLETVVTVRYEGGSETSQGYHDFHVRSGKVKKALIWLQKNNQYYKDIIISDENLKLLPDDGNISDKMNTISAESEKEKSQNPVNLSDNLNPEAQEKNNDVNENYIHESCMPNLHIPSQDEQVNNKLQWPTMSANPIDEFRTEGYIACAYPTLFPWGHADFLADRKLNINPSNYFRHLLRYHDDRFAKHLTFRFFALNSWMRWTALNDGNVFVKNNEEFKDITVSKLKEMIDENPNVMKKVMFQAKNLRGTNAYWHSRAGELKDMVEQIGLPTIFLTLSCADGHWEDLFRLLSPHSEVSKLTEKERRQLIQENPHIVDMFFNYRIESFIKNVLEKKYKIVDYWYRIEYQHRGSPHLHGVFWFEGAPDVTNLHNASKEKVENVIDYFSKLVSAINPAPNVCEGNVHPCRKTYMNVEDVQEDLAQLLRMVQRHKCNKAYCTRVNKKTREAECRFKFPFKMQDKAEILKGDSGNMEFTPERNDPLLNKFNAFIIQLWRANIDIAPVISEKALLAYLTKYISKCEVSSQGLDELFKNIMQTMDEESKAKRAIQRVFIKSCAERDISAQEVCHTMLGLKLFSAGGRQFVIINLSDKKWVALNEDEDGVEIENSKKGKSVVEKYRERPEVLKDLSLWEAVKWYNFKSWSKINRHNIVRVFPRLRINIDKESNESFYRQEVLLHVPWRYEKDLKSEDESWEDVYNKYNVQERNNVISLEGNDNESDTEYESESEEESDNDLDEHMILSQLAPKKNVPTVELGNREIDKNFDWSTTYEKYKEYGTIADFQKFLNKMKEETGETLQNFETENVIFSEDQSKVLQIIKAQIDYMKSENQTTSLPKRIIVQGKAGTGKSLLIRHITSLINHHFGANGFVLGTPTGVSAILVNGRTLHSIFHIPNNSKDFAPLKGSSARKMTNQFKTVKYVILDEYSMIGCKKLAMISARCKQATGNYEEDFGGLFVILTGDIKQLPPVKDNAFYSKTQNTLLGRTGKAIISNFEKTFILETCHRQQDKDFLKILDNLSDGNISREDYEVLKTRFTSQHSLEENNNFKDAVRLFATKEEVRLYNLLKLSELVDGETRNLVPVAKIPADHNCVSAKKGSSDDAQGLEKTLYLSKGCKIMLRQNLWLEKGLVNGTMGKVVDILYSQSNGERPAVILCEFEGYTGPSLIPNTNIIPITPFLKTWNNNKGVVCTRFQFPISLNYACSIHKAQGLTLNQVVVDIGPNDFSLGLSYVALSRVKSLQNLSMIPFAFSRLKKLSENPALILRKEFMMLLLHRSNQT